MSLLDAPSTPPAPAVVAVTSPVLTLVTTLVIPLVTIIGMIVLVALGTVDEATGVGVIGLLAGIHGGAVVATASASK